MSDLDFGVLPVINDELVSDYFDESEGYLELLNGGWSWTQTSVDFACLVSGGMHDRIMGLEKELTKARNMLSGYKQGFPFDTSVLIPSVAKIFNKPFNDAEQVMELYNEICTALRKLKVLGEIVDRVGKEREQYLSELLQKKKDLGLLEHVVKELIMGKSLTNPVKTRNKTTLEKKGIKHCPAKGFTYPKSPELQ